MLGNEDRPLRIGSSFKVQGEVQFLEVPAATLLHTGVAAEIGFEVEGVIIVHHNHILRLRF